MKLSVRERRLGDAQEQRLGHGRLLARPPSPVRSPPRRLHFSTCSPTRKLVSPTSLITHPAQHLPDDDLDVLVVDLHALEPVDLLDLVHQVAGQLLLAQDPEDVVRVGGAVHERLAGPDPVALVDADVLALGDQVLLGVIARPPA